MERRRSQQPSPLTHSPRSPLICHPAAVSLRSWAGGFRATRATASVGEECLRVCGDGAVVDLLFHEVCQPLPVLGIELAAGCFQFGLLAHNLALSLVRSARGRGSGRYSDTRTSGTHSPPGCSRSSCEQSQGFTRPPG